MAFGVALLFFAVLFVFNRIFDNLRHIRAYRRELLYMEHEEDTEPGSSCPDSAARGWGN